MQLRKITSLFAVAGFASLAFAVMPAPDGPIVNRDSINAGAGVAEPAPTGPTFINARIERLADGSVAFWGVSSVTSDSGELDEIRFDTEARPWSGNEDPDYVMSSDDWENVEIADGDEAGQFVIGGTYAETSENDELLALHFMPIEFSNDGLHDHGFNDVDDPGPRQGGNCRLSIKLSPGLIVVKCKPQQPQCGTTKQCNLSIIIYPNDGVIIFKCPKRCR